MSFILNEEDADYDRPEGWNVLREAIQSTTEKLTEAPFRLGVGRIRMLELLETDLPSDIALDKALLKNLCF